MTKIDMAESNSDRIQSVLEDLIDKHRIVFWYDEGGQMAPLAEALYMQGVEVRRLSNNPFSIKYRILKGEKPERGFIVYSSDARPEDGDNWLLDLEMEGILFSADMGSLYAAECGIPMELKHKVVDPHIQFFKSADNRCSLAKKLQPGMDWQKILHLMMGVTAKAEPVYDQILLALIKELTEEKSTIAESLADYNLSQDFWEELSVEFGYSGNRTIKDLLVVMFKDDMHHSSNGLHLSNAAHIFMRDWRDSRNYGDVYRKLAESLETELGVARELQNLSLDALTGIETFPCVDKIIAMHLQREFVNGSMSSEQMEAIIAEREHKVFWDVAAHTIRAIAEARKLVEKISRFMPGLHLNTPEEAFALYASELYQIDSDYRHFFREAKQTESKKLLTSVVERVQKIYSNSYLDELARKWQPLVDSMNRWRMNNVVSQLDFYRTYVNPFVEKKRKVFVIISDAMRYETMIELQLRIDAINRTETTLHPAMLSTLPSYTQLGMAALLPHTSIGYDRNQDEVFVDGMSTKGTPARQNVLQKYVPASWAVSAKDFLEITSPKTAFKDYDLIYIYSNRIDFVGDKRETEGEVFKATEDEFDQIVKIVELIRNGNGANILITSDHGYIFQNETLDESDFSDFKPEGNIITDTRRHVIGNGLKSASVMKQWSSEDVGLTHGREIQIAKGMNRMRKQGSGSRFVHGGSMLQEIAVPVLHVNIKKSSNISTVDVDILNRRPKITTNRQTISFFQTVAVSEKVTPITLKMGFYDEEGNLLSDSPMLTFGSTSNDTTQREQKHTFIFLNQLSSLNGKEVVLRMERKIPNTDQFSVYKEEHFKVSVMFANEF